MRGPFEFCGPPGPLLLLAVHAGHDVRSDVADLMALDDSTRRREEDPFTDRLIEGGASRAVVHRSRFEVDLNRPREEAVYREPGEAWGLDLWRQPISDELRAGSLTIYDAFYRALADHLDRAVEDGPVLVLDVHSYNHRRDGPTEPPAPQADNPDVNVGTGALRRSRWATTVDSFITGVAAERLLGRSLDVRENIRFRGGHLSRWVAARYPTTACPLAIECKKAFMDEWTGTPHHDHLARLGEILTTVAARVAAGLATDAP